jgi:Bacterial protein of unknown function (DUF937)
MPTSFLNIVHTYVTEAVVKKVAVALGESEATIKKAFEASIPLVLIGLSNRTNSSEGANLVIKLAYEQHQFKITNQIHEFFGAESTFWLSRGRGLVRSLFGIKCERIFETITSYSTISTNNAKSLLGITCSIIMAILGEHAIINKLNSCNVSTLLMECLVENKIHLPSSINSEVIFSVIENKNVITTTNNKNFISKAWASLQSVFSINL